VTVTPPEADVHYPAVHTDPLNAIAVQGVSE
jgi:hypothetical protein